MKKKKNNNNNNKSNNDDNDDDDDDDDDNYDHHTRYRGVIPGLSTGTRLMSFWHRGLTLTMSVLRGASIVRTVTRIILSL